MPHCLIRKLKMKLWFVKKKKSSILFLIIIYITCIQPYTVENVNFFGILKKSSNFLICFNKRKFRPQFYHTIFEDT